MACFLLQPLQSSSFQVAKKFQSVRNIASSKALTNSLLHRSHVFNLWQSNTDNQENNSNEGEEAVKKYGLEVGILKSYFDKSSKVKPKDLMSRYGIAYFGTSITLAIISYALCYVLIANGVDVASLLQKVGIKPSEAAVSAGTGSLAYAVHKAASPIRFIPTIILTPVVAKWIGKSPKAVDEGTNNVGEGKEGGKK